MATTTTNLGLTKPIGTEKALVSVINGNMDIIDNKVGAIPQNESVQSQITALNNQIGSFRFAVLTGTTNNSDTALSIDLPSGFTKDNCLVVAYGIDADNVWRNAGGGYNPNDFSSYGSVCALKTNENKITLSAIGTVVRNRPYKIILCRYI